MKRPLFLLITGLASFAAAQQLFTYRDPHGDLSVRAKSGLVQQVSSQKLHLELRGSPVVLESRTDGLKISAPTLNCDATVAKTTQLDRAVAGGGMRAVKTTSTGTTEITGRSATYSGGTQASSIKVSGSVTIRSTTGSRVTVVTGSSGTAELTAGKTATGSGLRRASLAGPVKVEARQDNGSSLVATGSRLDLDNVAHTITLTGNVSVTGKGPSALGELRGADRATLLLNSNGEVSSVRVSQGASQ